MLDGMSDMIYSDKSVNDCKPEEAERCWNIIPAKLATDDSFPDLLRAFGKLESV